MLGQIIKPDHFREIIIYVINDECTVCGSCADVCPVDWIFTG
ncbi:MAG: 4Fe-4S binding protein [Spirochaetales bacterium]|nr:4Fe-4S binding protein [Spirochaetales bacterium]